jgi:hypothetical protein
MKDVFVERDPLLRKKGTVLVGSVVLSLEEVEFETWVRRGLPIVVALAEIK